MAKTVRLSLTLKEAAALWDVAVAGEHAAWDYDSDGGGRPGEVAEEWFDLAQGSIEKLRNALNKADHNDILQEAISLRDEMRLKKVTCRSCGYVARVTQTWIDRSGPPICPTCYPTPQHQMHEL